jgi:uncharacterized MAPEG superfamily protein
VTTPFLCILIAFGLIYIPHFLAGAGRFKLPGGFDNAHPRDQTPKLEGWYRRASAAHQNGFETFSPFAAAVLVAHLGHGSPERAATLAIAFVVLRVLYIVAYIANLAMARSGLWTLMMSVTTWLFLLPLFS